MERVEKGRNREEPGTGVRHGSEQASGSRQADSAAGINLLAVNDGGVKVTCAPGQSGRKNWLAQEHGDNNGYLACGCN